MTGESYLSSEIDSAELRAQYDAHVRRLLKDKGVLAYILIHAVEEFRNYSLEEARSAIEGEPEVSVRPVRPSDAMPEAMNGEETESNIPGEGRMFFDIVFTVRTIDQTRQKIYINLEAQKEFYPGYDLVSRGVVYGCRMISQQMDTEYTSKDYDGVKKVYSIWICMNTPDRNNESEKVSDTIVEYAMEPKVLYKEQDIGNVAYGRYDLLSVLFICLKDDDTRLSENKLVSMLSVLLSSKMGIEDKKRELEEKYHLPMTREMERRAAEMCNLSEAIEERAEKRGMVKAREAMKAEMEAERRMAQEALKAKDEEIKALKALVASLQR